MFVQGSVRYHVISLRFPFPLFQACQSVIKLDRVGWIGRLPVCGRSLMEEGRERTAAELLSL